jgi:hypothetical protein
MRTLVKLTLGRALAMTLAEDSRRHAKLEQKAGLHELDRRRVKTGVGY